MGEERRGNRHYKLYGYVSLVKDLQAVHSGIEEGKETFLTKSTVSSIGKLISGMKNLVKNKNFKV